jgi:hypothetical protein
LYVVSHLKIDSSAFARGGVIHSPGATPQMGGGAPGLWVTPGFPKEVWFERCRHEVKVGSDPQGGTFRCEILPRQAGPPTSFWGRLKSLRFSTSLWITPIGYQNLPIRLGESPIKEGGCADESLMDPFSQPPHGFMTQKACHKWVERKLDRPSYAIQLLEQEIDFCAGHGWALGGPCKDVWR